MKKNLPIPFVVKNLFILVAVFLSFLSANSQSVKFGNSYVNLSKRTIGGTVQPGDTLEIRTNYYFPNAYNGSNIYYIRYLDNLPSNTAYVVNQLRQITNEGLTFSTYTDVSGDDAGAYIAAPAAGQYNIRINIGTGAARPTNHTTTNVTGSGSLRPNTDRPRVGGGMLVTTAFRVRVTGAIGTIITLGAGRLIYKKSNSSTGADTTVNAIRYNILISNNDPICSNAIGKNFVAEAGGTFDSSNTQNRSYGPSFLIPNYTYRNLTSTTAIGDGFYTIVNNLSPWASTFQNAQRRPSCPTAAGGPPPVPASCANRMFNGHWDIIGDHTGSSTPGGNIPKAPGTDGGYMLVVNADYATSEAYRQSIAGLCPNTSYEFSLWVRNVCPTCGIDVNGTATFTPGVLPNLTFAIDDLDRYSSGAIDTGGWVKKGFLFKTGPTQTDITISIRNNASGGGGNDWAIDDISLVTCNPDLNLIPSGNSNVCYGNQVDVSCTVNAFFDNYTNYRWERSIDDGATWSVAGTGSGTPLYNSGAYQYSANLPSFIADSSRHLNQYRFVVASSAANLSSAECAFEASTRIIVMVNNCGQVLRTELVNFAGRLLNNQAELRWTGENEIGSTAYEIERRDEGSGYIHIGTVYGKGRDGTRADYFFRDPLPVKGNHYYRLKIREENLTKLSREIVISNNLLLQVKSVRNPFKEILSWQIISPERTVINITLIDNYGRIVKTERQIIVEGLNNLNLTTPGNISMGSYILQIAVNGKLINQKVIKL